MTPGPLTPPSVDLPTVESTLAPLARLGYTTQGVLYLLVGVLATQTALGQGGTITDTQGALALLYHQAFGAGLLAAITLGFAGTALWHFACAILDVEQQGAQLRGVMTRLGYALSGMSATMLAFMAGQFFLGMRQMGQSSDAATQDWTAWLLQQPFGPFLVGIVGVTVVGFALTQVYAAIMGHLEPHLDLHRLSPEQQQMLMGLGRAGTMARGVVFSVIGIFLLRAAWQHNAGEARGLSGALGELLHQPLGPLVLGVVAFGLVAYGMYCFAEARYHHLLAS